MATLSPVLNSIRSEPRTRRVRAGLAATVLVAGVVLALLAAPSAHGASINANITADNSYEFAFGDVSGINQTVQGPVNNTLAAAIFSCASGPENWAGISANSNCSVLYLVSINDGFRPRVRAVALRSGAWFLVIAGTGAAATAWAARRT